MERGGIAMGFSGSLDLTVASRFTAFTCLMRLLFCHLFITQGRQLIWRTCTPGPDCLFLHSTWGLLLFYRYFRAPRRSFTLTPAGWYAFDVGCFCQLLCVSRDQENTAPRCGRPQRRRSAGWVCSGAQASPEIKEIEKPTAKWDESPSGSIHPSDIHIHFRRPWGEALSNHPKIMRPISPFIHPPGNPPQTGSQPYRFPLSAQVFIRDGRCPESCGV